MAITAAPLSAESSTFTHVPVKLESTATVQLSPQSPDASNDNLLIVSPYIEPAHLLDLGTLDTANQLLAKALTGLKCLRIDYATAPYAEIFNWSQIVQSVKDLASKSNFTWNEQGCEFFKS